MSSPGDRMPPELDAMADALSRSWNALVRGEPVPEHDASPFAPTLRQLHTIDDAPALSPERQARIWRELMAAPADRPAPTARGPLPPALDGRALASMAGAPPARQRWPMTILASAAVLALMLVSVLLTVELSLPNRRLAPAHPTGAPLTFSPPTPPAVRTEPLLAGRFETIPSDASWIGVERYTAPPGAAWTQGTASMSGVGPMLYRIEQGAVTVQTSGQIDVTRAGQQGATRVLAGATTTLAGGDVAFMPSGVVTHWRNDGTDPAVILDGGITTVGSADLSMLKPFTQPINDWGVAPPKAPVDFAVRRITVPPGGTARSDPTPGMKLMAVEAGRVDIVWAASVADALQAAQATVAAPASNQLTANHWVDINQSHHYASELRNAGPDPLIFLVLTVAPADGEPAGPSGVVAVP